MRNRSVLPALVALVLTIGCISEDDARTALRDDHVTPTTLTRTTSGITEATYSFAGTHDDGRDCTGTVALHVTSPFSKSWTIDTSCSLPEDPTRLATMCESGSYVGACGHASHLFRDGTGVAADEARAYRMAHTGCAAGNATACFYEGVALADGRGAAVDVPAAIVCYRTACAADDSAACGNLGDLLANATPRDGAGALEAFAHACRLEGHGGACHDHAAIVMMEASEHTPEELTDAMATEERECQAGTDEENLEACSNAGIGYRDGTGVVADPARALPLFQRACASGRTVTCMDVGVAMYTGAGTAVDVPGALAMFRRACDGNDAVSCRNVGVALRDGGAGLPSDPAAARVAFEHACSLGDAPACHEVGR